MTFSKENLQKVALKYAKKIPSLTLRLVKGLFYPPAFMVNGLLHLLSSMLKIVSFEKSKLFSKLYEHYFAQILKAKAEKRSIEIKVNIEDTGAIFQHLKQVIEMTFFIISLIYVIAGTTLPTLILLGLQQANVISFTALSWGFTLSSLLFAYYIGLFGYMSIKNIFATSPNQKYLKFLIFDELAYIYAKSAEVDEEVAEITIQNLKRSLIIEDEEKKNEKIKDLKVFMGVEK